MCNELLSSLEHRGLCLEGEILYAADGGKGIIKDARSIKIETSKPTLLRKSLYSTNSIESMLSQVSHLHGGLKNMKGGKQVARRWVGSNLLEGEKKFRTAKGCLSINQVKDKIKGLRKREAKVA